MKLLVVEDNARLSDRIQQHLRPLREVQGSTILKLLSKMRPPWVSFQRVAFGREDGSKTKYNKPHEN